MKRKPGARPHGQIRQSQIVTTFGPGAMLDLPKHSVLVAGLEYWTPGGEEIIEPRLVEKLKRLLNVPFLKFLSPPPDQEDPTAPQTGITAWQFPEWFITQDVIDKSQQQGETRSRMLVHRTALMRGQFIDDVKDKWRVVPIRFVRACRCGHIGDIEWRQFVHGGQTECRLQLWIDERGTSGDLAEIWIRCDCKAQRSMSEAALMQTGSLGNCDGSRPWLGPYTKESCGEPNRLLIRTASNTYFPQQMSVISLPDRDEVVAQAVDQVWQNFLEFVETIDDLRDERRRKPPVKAALEELSDEEVFAEIQVRRCGGAGITKTVKQAELETLMVTREEIGEDRPDGKFFARALPREKWDRPWMNAIERVVLVHRLREVVALAGFTRFEAAAPDVAGELEMGVRRASLAREISWLPAVENKGEGVFLQFRSDAIEAWLQRSDVIDRGRRLQAGFECWRREHQGTRRQFPGLQYILLHSFSHLLVTSVSLECGYPASSIRERIYALPDTGYGVLLYTGSSDAEGTLGGLIQVGRRVHEHIEAALKLGVLCSNDPVCAQHESENTNECRFLHGAACHGCLLIAETSCEQHNEFLDRALVVPTVENRGIEFFSSVS
ncbi:MAG: DUF1998 domain-containing protein [Planctomycetes bacterium]|nr:DUF1998 domain-containing protein [Planctomycetota bacterium]